LCHYLHCRSPSNVSSADSTSLETMVQFGKTLNDVVKSDWRCHAVAYMELKRALSESHTAAIATSGSIPSVLTIADDGPREEVNARCDTIHKENAKGCIIDPAASNDETNTVTTHNDTPDDDAHSVHTESSYDVSDIQKANFFRIYEDSIRRLTNFYESRVIWAGEERRALEFLLRAAEDNKAAREETGGLESMLDAKNVNMNQGLQWQQLGQIKEDETPSKDQLSSSSLSLPFLIQQIENFSSDLRLALEFLELNATAFSKIMKKFDKRTGSDMLEDKLKELKADHPYLYGGGELRKCKSLCAEWMKVAKKLQPETEKSKGHLAANSSSSSLHSNGPAVGLSLDNSLVVEPEEMKKVIIDSRGGDNPQQSSEINAKDAIIPENMSMCYEVNTPQQRSVPRSIHKTKEALILEKMIDRVSEELCLQKADSPFFDNALEQTPPPYFASSEVEIVSDKALGKGEFCKIYEVSQFKVPESCHICFLHRGFKDPEPSMELASDESSGNPSHRKVPSGSRSSFSFNYDANIADYDELESDHEDEDYKQTTRGFMKDHCLRNGESRYAIKRIRSDIVGKDDIADAAIDLAREAEFLAALKHPNIIRIRGTINVPGHPKYSLVLDRLYDTLEVQMKKWKLDKKQYQGKFKGLIRKNQMMLDKLWMDRLVATYDLARAMAYLHGHRILHRDIKPANIGFDIRGDIKIFDFGLAKELKPIDRESKDKYHTDGIAGTRRYMAPEVAQIMPYGLSADVYSFGILMWEMLSLKDAFKNLTREKHYKYVIVEGNRPKVFKSWPFEIKNLLQRCWHKVPQERPTFQAVRELIKFGLPIDTGDVSCRSNDLLLRSLRSNRGDVNVSTSYYDARGSEHRIPMESEKPCDPLKFSIRDKSQHLNKRKHHDHKVMPAQV